VLNRRQAALRQQESLGNSERFYMAGVSERRQRAMYEQTAAMTIIRRAKKYPDKYRGIDTRLLLERMIDAAVSAPDWCDGMAKVIEEAECGDAR